MIGQITEKSIGVEHSRNYVEAYFLHKILESAKQLKTILQTDIEILENKIWIETTAFPAIQVGTSIPIPYFPFCFEKDFRSTFKVFGDRRMYTFKVRVLPIAHKKLMHHEMFMLI
jgi:hypothetical protein